MDPLEERGREAEKRSAPRIILEDYYSVEFPVNRHLPVHQFRVRDLSPWGVGILIKEGSAALERLKTGETLDMKFNPASSSREPEYLKTEIRHITYLKEGRFRGHYLVGLRILYGRPDTEGGSAG